MAAIGSKNAPTDGYGFACSAAGGHGQGEQKGHHVYQRRGHHAYCHAYRLLMAVKSHAGLPTGMDPEEGRAIMAAHAEAVLRLDPGNPWAAMMVPIIPKHARWRKEVWLFPKTGTWLISSGRLHSYKRLGWAGLGPWRQLGDERHHPCCEDGVAHPQERKLEEGDKLMWKAQGMKEVPAQNAS